MRLIDWVILAFLSFLVFVSLLNPGGFLVVLVIIVFVAAVRLSLPWFADYYTAVNRGKAGRKAKHAARSDHGGDDSIDGSGRDGGK